MLRFVSRLVATLTRSAGAAGTPSAPRRARLGLEGLESRALLSASPLTLHSPAALVQHVAPVNPALVNATVLSQVSNQAAVYTATQSVPNLAGVSFHLTSGSGKPAHDLAIQSETILPDGSATFTGTWKGDKDANSAPKPITGTLKLDASGNVTIWFSWANGSGGQNTFNGTITKVYNNPYVTASLYGFHYHLEGDVTTPTPGGGPGHVSGNAAPPTPVMSAGW